MIQLQSTSAAVFFRAVISPVAAAFVIRPISCECTHPRRLAVLCFSRPLKNCAHLTTFCIAFLLQGDPRISSQSFRSAPAALRPRLVAPLLQYTQKLAQPRNRSSMGVHVTARLVLNTSPVDRVGRPECRRVDQVRQDPRICRQCSK